MCIQRLTEVTSPVFAIGNITAPTYCEPRINDIKRRTTETPRGLDQQRPETQQLLAGYRAFRAHHRCSLVDGERR